MNNAITTLVGEDLEEAEWGGSLAAPNGSVYGIPAFARRVAKFNPIDKSITEIGPDFGDGWKWGRGAITDSGIIYCPPRPCISGHDRGILKIDTNTDAVIELDRNFIPESDCTLNSCAAALDGCIYFMPHDASRIMKLDPNNNDAMTSVGEDLGNGSHKYSGTVVGIDGCVYGIPYLSKHILKYDPINDTTSFREADGYFYCSGGATERDGCIYALTKDGRVLKIDPNNNSHYFVGNSTIQLDPSNYLSWGDAILGIDGCIYWPPKDVTRTLKYDPHSNQT